MLPQRLWLNSSKEEYASHNNDLCLFVDNARSGSGVGAGELLGGDLSFTGVVMAYPCSIAPESERVPVNFGEVSTKSLYINGKTTPIPFTIKLQDCTPNVLTP